jgi:hypothetical protein
MLIHLRIKLPPNFWFLTTGVATGVGYPPNSQTKARLEKFHWANTPAYFSALVMIISGKG